MKNYLHDRFDAAHIKKIIFLAKKTTTTHTCIRQEICFSYKCCTKSGMKIDILPNTNHNEIIKRIYVKKINKMLTP